MGIETERSMFSNSPTCSYCHDEIIFNIHDGCQSHEHTGINRECRIWICDECHACYHTAIPAGAGIKCQGEVGTCITCKKPTWQGTLDQSRSGDLAHKEQVKYSIDLINQNSLLNQDDEDSALSTIRHLAGESAIPSLEEYAKRCLTTRSCSLAIAAIRSIGGPSAAIALARLAAQKLEMPVFLRIRHVDPLEGFRVRLHLTNGKVIERDLKPLLKGPVFQAIRDDPTCFRAVAVVNGTLCWPGEIDLDPDVVIWDGPCPDLDNRLTALVSLHDLAQRGVDDCDELPSPKAGKGFQLWIENRELIKSTINPLLYDTISIVESINKSNLCFIKTSTAALFKLYANDAFLALLQAIEQQLD